jgi:hypothetical protein
MRPGSGSAWLGGFLVSSTEPASARYSRDRDSANRIMIERIHAVATNATAISNA